MFRHHTHVALLGVLSCIMSTATAGEDRGLAAREEAKASGKFLVAFFSDQKAEAAKTAAVRASVQDSVKALAAKTAAVYIDMDDAAQQGLVREFNLRYAPRPIVLVLSPNGAVTGSFQKPFTPEELGESLPGPGMQQALKALQERKLVLLRVGTKDSPGDSAAAEAAKGFLEDPRFKESAVQIVINPDDPEERNTLKQLQINSPEASAPAPRPQPATGSETPAEGKGATASPPPAAKAARPVVSILLAPPGILIGRWEGAVTKEAFVQGLIQAMSRGGGCGASCADPSCPPPPKEGK